MENETVDKEIALLEQNFGWLDGGCAGARGKTAGRNLCRKGTTDELYAYENYGKVLEMFHRVYDSDHMTYQFWQNMAILYENMDRFDEAKGNLF